jgi:uncharacterized protein YecE (DUF72 family)
MQIYIGCSGFYNKDWKNVFYPEGLPQSKWFDYYCSRFNTLELNTTFYSFPTVARLKKWYEKSPPHFKFSVKAPRLITHYKKFNGTESLLEDFYAAIREGLKEKLATVLFQLPANMKFNEEFFQRIIHSLDESFDNVIEFRDAGWWNEYVFETLSHCNIAFCGVSHPALPSGIIDNAEFIYYRFHGILKLYYSQYPDASIKQFAEWLCNKSKNKKAYIYFNNTATMAAINNASELEKFIVNLTGAISS